MPKFLYTARGFDGKTAGGEMVAKDEQSLAQQLRSEGFLVTSIKSIEEKKDRIQIKVLDRFFGVPLKEKMIFARNLSIMISAGLTVSRAVHNISLQTRNKKFQKVIADIYEELQAGKTLSEGLAKYPVVFNDLFVNMVKVGEAAGNLDEVLNIVAVQLEKENELISKVRGAMIYPAVIIVAMMGIGVIMLTYVIPRLTSVFQEMEVKLPASTLFIISLSNFLRNHSFIVISLFISLFIFLKFFLQTKAGKITVSFIVIKLPVIKNIIVKVNCARFSRIYSSLLKSGVSVVDALRIVSNTLTNYYYKKAIEEGISKIQKGVNLSVVIAENSKIFPSLVMQMLEVGEETGRTEGVLLKLAEFYEEEVSQITKNLSSIIEPILMLLVGVAVGFFAVAMLQPMYSVMENIK